MALQRPPRRVSALVVAVGIVVVATLVGLVVLWPPPSAPGPDTGRGQPLVDATIVAMERLPDEGQAGAQARISFELTEGDRVGQTVTVDMLLDGLPELAVGDRVVVDAAGADASDLYIVDLQRTTSLWVLVASFVGVVLLVGRWHGLRSLLGLGVSLFLVARFVVPAILAGSPPAVVALVGSVAIMLATLYLAHGVSPRTTVAVVGTTIALGLTVVLALVFLDWSAITGNASDEARFARVVVADLDLAGLVLAGLIIAALGVLDDVTVAQAGTAWALHDTDPRLTAGQVFRRTMAVGRDHIASTVNTLFLAYAGASLSLLVVFSTGGRSLGEIVTSEVVATELVKTLVGSLGLIAAVPATTALAAVVVTRRSDGEVAQSRRRRGGDVADDHDRGRLHDPDGDRAGGTR